MKNLSIKSKHWTGSVARGRSACLVCVKPEGKRLKKQKAKP